MWYRLVATALIRPLAWDPPHAVDAALEKAKRQKKKKRKKKKRKEERKKINYSHFIVESKFTLSSPEFSSSMYSYYKKSILLEPSLYPNSH